MESWRETVQYSEQRLMCARWTDYANAGQVLPSAAFERTLERSYAEENLTRALLPRRQTAASHGLWRTRFNFYSDSVWLVYVCVCVGGGGGNVFISSHDFQVFEILKRITCDCREQKGQSWKKQAKLWWNDWRAWQATKQRREERQTHKRGELKLTVCTWCVPEDPWFTHTSCQSAAGFWICGLELDWMVWGGSHDTRRTWCRWVPKRKAAPCWACLCSTTPEVFRRSSLPHYEMVLKEKHVRHRWKFRRLCFQLSSDFTGGK